MGPTQSPDNKPKRSIFTLLVPYKGMIVLLILFALISNGVNLILPKIISHGIDDYTHGKFVFKNVILTFFISSLIIFIFTWLQSIVQVYASEKVAKDVRSRLSEKISQQTYAFVQQANPNKLLTNLTSDIDSIKMFVSQAIVAIASSLFIIIGASILLLTINWRLALVVLLIIPIIGGAFYLVLKKVRVLFTKSRAIIDALNKTINESILGSSLIRVINSQQLEYDKFLASNTEAKNLGLSILKMFAALVPIITFVANLATLSILAIGGKFVINGSMSLGDFAAFTSYLALLIFPILVIGFMSNVIAQSTASYNRISEVLYAKDAVDNGTVIERLKGNIEFKNVSITYGQKPALKDVSFTIQAGCKTAIIGPTAAGKTQLLYLMTGLIKPKEGAVTFDGRDIDEYKKDAFYAEIGFVFQDSIIFNLSVKENIAFNEKVTDASFEKAVEASELKDFIASLPEKDQTIVSERGSSLSGGQKQRIMLARALAVEPSILLLDDFTARVDTNTEQKILQNVAQDYPGITLISVTQKIASVEHFDKIILLMEGEVIAEGTHEQLMETCPEYVQIFNSQRSTSNYELQPQ